MDVHEERTFAEELQRFDGLYNKLGSMQECSDVEEILDYLVDIYYTTRRITLHVLIRDEPFTIESATEFSDRIDDMIPNIVDMGITLGRSPVQVRIKEKCFNYFRLQQTLREQSEAIRRWIEDVLA